MHVRRSSLLVIATLLAGCAGGSSSVPTSPTVAQTSSPAQSARQMVAFSFTIAGGSAQSSANARNLRFIDPGSNGLVLTESNCTAGGTPQASCTATGSASVGNGLSIIFDISPSSPNCSGSPRTCTVYFPAAPGTNLLFEADFYAQAPVNGSFANNLGVQPLSMYQTGATTVVMGQQTSITLYSQGIIASISAGTSQQPFIPGVATFPLAPTYVVSTNGTASANLVLSPLPNVFYKDLLGTVINGANPGCPPQDRFADPAVLTTGEYLANGGNTANGSSLSGFQIKPCGSGQVQIVSGSLTTAVKTPSDQPIVTYQGSSATSYQAFNGYFSVVSEATVPGAVYPQLATGLPATGAVVASTAANLVVSPLFGGLLSQITTVTQNPLQINLATPPQAPVVPVVVNLQGSSRSAKALPRPGAAFVPAVGSGVSLLFALQPILPTAPTTKYTATLDPATCKSTSNGNGIAAQAVFISGPLTTDLPATGGTAIFATGGGAVFSLQPGSMATPSNQPCLVTVTDPAGTSFQALISNPLSGGPPITIPS